MPDIDSLHVVAGDPASQPSHEPAPAGQTDEAASSASFFDGLLVAARRGAGPAQILDYVRQGLEQLRVDVGAEGAAYLAWNEDTDEMVYSVGIGSFDVAGLQWLSLGRGEGLAQWVMAKNCPVIVNDAVSDDRFAARPLQAAGVPVRSVLAAPLIIENERFGAIEVINKRGVGQLFTLGDQHKLVACAPHIAGLLEQLLIQTAPPSPLDALAKASSGR